MRPRFSLILFLLMLILPGKLFAAQSSGDIPVTNDQKEAALRQVVGAKAEKMPREEAYVIGHGDILSVNLYEEGEMTVPAITTHPKEGGTGKEGSTAVSAGGQVMMDGRISLRDIGDVNAAGLTLAEFADYLKKLYSAIYDKPVVTTTLIQSNSLRFTVMGAVTKPGIYKLEHPMNLMQALAQAGGFTEWADKEVKVVREDIRPEDKGKFDDNILVFEYDKFLSGKNLDKNIFVRSGDIVIVK